MKTLPKNFYDRDTVKVAQDLIGKKIVRIYNGQILSAIIAETESYRSDDPACHAYRGQTERNKALFGPVGHTYVYFTYGMHYCLNIVARDTKNFVSGGVLIRAIIPVEGQEIMAQRRKKVENIIDGPGKVTQALGINCNQIGIDVTDSNSEIYITEGIIIDSSKINKLKRIGITQATEKLWRFRLFL